MVKQLRYGMVGGDLKAFIGEVHRKAINFDTRAKLVAGCFSADEKLGVETAEAYNVDPSRTYKDYKEMAEKESQREDKIDFVSICTPNFLHYQIAKEFLLHDINVVCEKPLCFTQEEAVELEKIAKERNLVFAITYTYTGYTMVKVAKEMIEKGKIGKIVSINVEYKWKDGNLVTALASIMGYDFERGDRTYSDIPNDTNLDLNSLICLSDFSYDVTNTDYDGELFGIYGKRSDNMLSSDIWDKEEICKYEYELDDQERIVKIEVYSSYSDAETELEGTYYINYMK